METINLNNIVKDVVEYEAAVGGLSAVIPQNLDKLEPFTDNDNVVVKNSDIILNGFKIKIIDNVAGISTYFPDYYSSVSSDIIDEGTLDIDDEEFSANVSGIIDNLNSNISSFNEWCDSLTSGLLSTDVLSAARSTSTKIKLAKRDMYKNDCHGIPSTLDDDDHKYLSTLRRWAQNSVNKMGDLCNGEWQNINLSGALKDVIGDKEIYSPERITAHNIFKTLVDDFNDYISDNNKSGIDVWLHPTFGNIYEITYLDYYKTAMNYLKVILKDLNKIIKSFRIVSDEVKDYCGKHDKDEMCTMKVSRIKKMLPLLGDFEGILNNICLPESIQRIEINRICNAVSSNDSSALDYLIGVAVMSVVYEFCDGIRREVVEYIDEALRAHYWLDHEDRNINLRLRYNKDEVYKIDYGRHNHYEVMESYERTAEKLKYVLGRLTSPNNDMFVAGAKQSTLDALHDRLFDILALQIDYNDYMENGDNTYVKKINKYEFKKNEGIFLDDVNVQPVLCNKNRKLEVNKRGLCGDDWNHEELLQTIKRNVQITPAGSFNVACENGGLKSGCKIRLSIRGDLKEGLASGPEYYESSATSHELFFCGEDHEKNSSYCYEDVEAWFEIYDDSTLVCENTEIGSVYVMTAKLDDIPALANVYYKIKPVCELFDGVPLSRPRLSCSLSGWIETLSCENCGGTYQFCNEHNISSEHHCNPAGSICSKDGGWYGNEGNAPSALNLDYCHKKNNEHPIDPEGIPSHAWVEDGLVKYNLSVHYVLLCHALEGQCAGESHIDPLTDEWTEWGEYDHFIIKETVTLCPNHDDIPLEIENGKIYYDKDSGYYCGEIILPWDDIYIPDGSSIRRIDTQRLKEEHGHTEPVYCPVTVTGY